RSVSRQPDVCQEPDLVSHQSGEGREGSYGGERRHYSRHVAHAGRGSGERTSKRDVGNGKSRGQWLVVRGLCFVSPQFFGFEAGTVFLLNMSTSFRRSPTASHELRITAHE